MITFDFDYYRTCSIDETLKLYEDLTSEGKNAIFYSGGTEIITFARTNKICFDAVIDIKEIPECNIFEYNDDKLIIGSAVSLTKICDSKLFPLLSDVCRRAADHTARNKITFGGNICGNIPYREAVLPLLITDCEMVIAGRNGINKLPITQMFNKQLLLNKGEFFVQAIIDKKNIELIGANIREVRIEKVDYPIISAAAVFKEGKIQAAVSGLCSDPFIMELNKDSIKNLEGNLPSQVVDDIMASSGYRKFVAENAFKELYESFGGKM